MTRENPEIIEMGVPHSVIPQRVDVMDEHFYARTILQCEVPMVELQDTPFIWMAATRHEFGYSRRMNCGQWPLSGLDYSSNA